MCFIHILEEMEKLDDALADINRVLKLVPELTSARIDRSILYLRQEKMDLAIADIQFLLGKNPDNIPLKMQLANYYAIDHQFAKALEIYDALLKADSRNPDVLRARGDVYLRLGKHANAVKDLTQAVKLEPKDTASLNNLAWLYATATESALKRPERALALAERAAALSPRPHVLDTLAQCYFVNGRIAAALAAAQKALQAAEKDRSYYESQLAKFRQALE